MPRWLVEKSLIISRIDFDLRLSLLGKYGFCINPAPPTILWILTSSPSVYFSDVKFWERLLDRDGCRPIRRRHPARRRFLP